MNANIEKGGSPPLDEIISMGQIFAKSGYFPDAKEEAQAVVKILCGRELGLEPIASMSGIAIVKGRPQIGANLIAALIRRSNIYDYRIKRLDDEGCEIEFLRGPHLLGLSVFTQHNAEAAGLLGGENWRKYPRNMFFARAMSNGAKWFCPDVFAGQPVYVPGELGGPEEALDIETGEALDIETGEVLASAPPPSPLEQLRDALLEEGIDPDIFTVWLAHRGKLRAGQGLAEYPESELPRLLKTLPQALPLFREWEKGQVAEALGGNIADLFPPSPSAGQDQATSPASPETSAAKLAKAEALAPRVARAEDGAYLVPASKGGVHRVVGDQNEWTCDCSGYRFRAPNSPQYQCSHIMAAKLAAPALMS